MNNARALLAAGDYDLVFLDIQLLGGLGFDHVPQVREQAKIVFVSAHDGYAIRAFEVNALDYLLKPATPARLAATLRRLDGEASRGSATATPFRTDDLVLLKVAPAGRRFVRAAEIVVINSCENYSEVRLVGGDHVMVRRTMKAWEELLPATHFLRVHRNHIVNVALVDRFEPQSEDTALLFVKGLAEPLRARRDVGAAIEERLGLKK
jgi:two-component system LytT family response regulator